MARIKVARTGAPPQKKRGLPPPEQIARVLGRRGTAGIDSGALLATLIEKWGGIDRFAADIMLEYQAAKPGGLTRQRILEMINRLCVVVTTQEIARPREAASMSDEDLVEAARTLVRRLGGPDDPAPPAGPEEGPLPGPPARAPGPAAP
jgi:hypothetical protein